MLHTPHTKCQIVRTYGQLASSSIVQLVKIVFLSNFRSRSLHTNMFDCRYTCAPGRRHPAIVDLFFWFIGTSVFPCFVCSFFVAPFLLSCRHRHTHTHSHTHKRRLYYSRTRNRIPESANAFATHARSTTAKRNTFSWSARSIHRLLMLIRVERTMCKCEKNENKNEWIKVYRLAGWPAVHSSSNGCINCTPNMVHSSNKRLKVSTKILYACSENRKNNCQWNGGGR